MSKKCKNFKCTTLDYIKHFLSSGSVINGCISISAFASLLGIPIGITSSGVGLKIRVIGAGIKLYNSIIKKKKRKHDKIVLLAKYKLNCIEVLISKSLFASNIRNISHDEFVLRNNVLKEYNDMKEEVKHLKS